MLMLFAGDLLEEDRDFGNRVRVFGGSEELY